MEIPAWVDTNALRISFSLVDGLLSVLQQIATPEGNQYVGRLSRLLRAPKVPRKIPERTGRIYRRQAKGSLGGRPPDFDADPYKERNTVERGFGSLKRWRGIATCYDKHALIYLAAIVLNHRTRT